MVAAIERARLVPRRPPLPCLQKLMREAAGIEKNYKRLVNSICPNESADVNTWAASACPLSYGKFRGRHDLCLLAIYSAAAVAHRTGA